MFTKLRSSLRQTSSWNFAERLIPPGTADASIRAATLTPSP
ncbi:MAG: hypothetical protein VYA66_01725 [SAR324 cluster bacterium]|nr:hypothetical protein [SAR324 cluster bacterium]